MGTQRRAFGPIEPERKNASQEAGNLVLAHLIKELKEKAVLSHFGYDYDLVMNAIHPVSDQELHLKASCF